MEFLASRGSSHAAFAHKEVLGLVVAHLALGDAVTAGPERLEAACGGVEGSSVRRVVWGWQIR